MSVNKVKIIRRLLWLIIAAENKTESTNKKNIYWGSV
jgi:hypothetical protein